MQQEKELVFESVTQEDMIRLGWTLYENNKNKACMRMDFITSLSDTYFSLFFSSK